MSRATQNQKINRLFQLQNAGAIARDEGTKPPYKPQTLEGILWTTGYLIRSQMIEIALLNPEYADEMIRKGHFAPEQIDNERNLKVKKEIIN